MRSIAFRAATLTLERIERKKQSLASALQESLRKARVRLPEDRKDALALTLNALRYFPEADLLLSRHGLYSIPLRRKCAFRVAYAALKTCMISRDRLEILKGGLLPGRLWKMVSPKSIEHVEALRDELPEHERLAVEYTTPPWIVRHLLEKLGRNETIKLLKALWKQPVWVRINTLKAEEGKILRRLERLGIRLRRDSELPYVYEVLSPPIGLTLLKPFTEGYAIKEDKGSAVVVHVLRPERDDLIYDATAAPGVKTSHMYQLAKAEIVAGDISIKRVRSMVLLKARLRYDAHIAVMDSRSPPFRRAFNKALVDAPCTNSGAIGSDPGLRLALWKKVDVEKYFRTQIALLRAVARTVKPRGYVVYSTCSLLSQEGEEVVEQVVNDGVYDVEDVGWGSPGYPDYSVSGKVCRLHPHVHRTIAFFIAKLRVRR